MPCDGSWRRRTPLSWSDVRSILIIKPSSLGDIVHALPTARALRRLWPSASLSWMVKQRWAEVLDGNPDLDHVLAVDLSIGGWAGHGRAARRCGMSCLERAGAMGDESMACRLMRACRGSAPAIRRLGRGPDWEPR